MQSKEKYTKTLKESLTLYATTWYSHFEMLIGNGRAPVFLDFSSLGADNGKEVFH